MDRIYGRKPVLDTLDSDIEIYRAYILRQNSKIIDKLIKKLRAKNIEIDLSLIHISEPTRRHHVSRMPSSA